MSSDFQTEYARKARKHHHCAICRRSIAPGTEYTVYAGVWQGDFSSAKMHTDCRAVWNDLFSDWGDSNEGMLHDLLEVFSDSGELWAAQESLDALRGQYPHAVTRLEFTLSHWLEEWDA